MRRPLTIPAALLVLTLAVAVATGPAIAGNPANDPFFDQQQNLRDINYVQPATANDANGIRVALLDTGFDRGHAEFDFFLKDPPVVLPDHEACPDQAHGTDVAGVVGARTGNFVGGAGVADDVTMFPIELRHRDGGCGIISDAWPDALMALADLDDDERPHVANMSFGATYFSRQDAVEREGLAALEREERAVRYATNYGILLVAAAGNDFVTRRRRRAQPGQLQPRRL